MGLTLDEAAAMVHTSRRSWERWEAGRPVPPATLELLQLKMRGEVPAAGRRDMVVVLRADGGFIQPIDVVAADNFVDCVEGNDGTATIRSLASDDQHPLPYVHATKFTVADNQHVLSKAAGWKTFAERFAAPSSRN
jgi:hypothetical protein